MFKFEMQVIHLR